MLDVLDEALWGTGCGGGRGMHMYVCVQALVHLFLNIKLVVN